MKLLFSLFLLQFFLACSAQTDTGTRLNADLSFDSNVFFAKQEKTDFVIDGSGSSQPMKKIYKGELIGGSVGFLIGGSLMGLGVHLNSSKFGNNYTEKQYHVQSTVSFIFGSFCIGAGTYFIAKGLIERKRYIERVDLSPTSASITFKF